MSGDRMKPVRLDKANPRILWPLRSRFYSAILDQISAQYYHVHVQIEKDLKAMKKHEKKP